MRAVVVLPTYNERDNIEPYLRSLRAVRADIEVLVVDDDSPDGTADLARTLADELGGISVLQRTAKHRLGSGDRARRSARLQPEAVRPLAGQIAHHAQQVGACRQHLAQRFAGAGAKRHSAATYAARPRYASLAKSGMKTR